MHMANCSLRPDLRAVLTPRCLLTNTRVSVLPSPLTRRCASSLPPLSSPQKLGRKALRRPLSSRLARAIPRSRNSSTSRQELPLPTALTEEIDSGRHSVASFDQFAEQVIREMGNSPKAEPTCEAPSQEGSSVRPSTTNPKLLWLSLFERLVSRGLLPRVTTEPPSPVGRGSAWTVTISLPELGIDIEGRGSDILLAEVAAAIQLELALGSPEVGAKLQSYPETPLSPITAKNIVQSYWQFTHASCGPLKRNTTGLDSGAFEARTFAGSTQIGEPATSAVKDSARDIQSLVLAHGIINGQPDLWPAPPQNPFQAKIVLDHARLGKLQHVVTAATEYLRTTPGQVVDGKQRGTFHRHAQDGFDHDVVNIQEGKPEALPQRDIPELESWLAALPFSPSMAKMLVVGASIRCLEHAIITAAAEKHAVYRRTARRGQEEDGYRNPAVMNVMEGDHNALLLLFQRFRDESWIKKRQSRLPKTEDGQEKASQPHDDPQNQAKELMSIGNDPKGDHKGLQTSPNTIPEPVKPSPTEHVTVARRFDHYDPDGIASVSAAAREIERSMVTAGLVSYPKETSYISAPGSELKIRAEPYGGDLSKTTHRKSILRHLVVLGFADNIAQIGHGSLIPGQPPQLRIRSQEVYVDSPLKAHMPLKQLQKTLKAGPLMVVTGVTNNTDDGGLSARYCSPISTWEAVLLGKDLTPGEPPLAGAAQVLVNNWFPVLVKSEVGGVSNEQARDMLFKAREALHRAIDKATFDYIKYSWNSFDFYDLLSDLPNEDSFEAKALPKEKRDAMKNEPRRPHPIRQKPTPKDGITKTIN